jgi:hypothetical protein
LLRKTSLSARVKLGDRWCGSRFQVRLDSPAVRRCRGVLMRSTASFVAAQIDAR